LSNYNKVDNTHSNKLVNNPNMEYLNYEYNRTFSNTPFNMRGILFLSMGQEKGFTSVSCSFHLLKCVAGCQLIPIFLYNSYILGQNPIF